MRSRMASRSRRSDDFAASLKGLGERHLVRVLEIAAHRETAGDASDTNTKRSQQLREIERGRLTFHVGVGGQNDLGPPAALEAGEQLPDLDVVGPDPVQW